MIAYASPYSPPEYFPKPQESRRALRYLTLWALLRWAYGEQRVGILSGDVLPPAYTGTRSDLENLGTTVDGSTGCWGASSRCSPDADAIANLVASLGRQSESLIAEYAERGEYPELCDETPYPIPAMPFMATDEWDTYRENGIDVTYRLITIEVVTADAPVWEFKPSKGMHVARYEKRKTEVKACPIVWEPDPAFIDMKNNIRKLWIEAMNALFDLAEAFCFRDHKITGLFCDNDAKCS